MPLYRNLVCQPGIRKPSLLYSPMKVLLLMLAHLLTTLAKLLGPGGARAIVADSYQLPAAA
jgi:hypothetical protein